jgi:hypothetical protein
VSLSQNFFFVTVGVSKKLEHCPWQSFSALLATIGKRYSVFGLIIGDKEKSLTNNFNGIKLFFVTDSESK